MILEVGMEEESSINVVFLVKLEICKVIFYNIKQNQKIRFVLILSMIVCNE